MKLSDIEFRAMDSQWRKVIDEIKCVLRPSGSLFDEGPRGADIRLFDFFRWGHPHSDFGAKRMENI